MRRTGPERATSAWRNVTGITIAATLLGAGSVRAFDHEPWDRLLREHVVGGLVDYDAFAAAPAFRAYLDSVEAADPAPLGRAERLAFWINAYNAWTVQLVAETGERDSIKNVGRGAGELEGAFSRPFARVAGRTWSLDQIENEVIRPRFGDPRVHFALVCAALGCPPLRAEAYRGDRLDAQLDDQTRVFLLRSPDRNGVDVEAGVVSVSPLFEWYAEDFGGTPEAIGRFLARFHPPGPERELLESGRFRLVTTGWDWTLNSRSRMSVQPFRVLEGILRYAEEGDVERLRRSLGLIQPLLTAHLDVLGSRRRQRTLDLLGAEDAATLRRGARRLLVDDIVVLLRGVPGAPAERARTLIRSAELEWQLLERSVGQDGAGVGEALGQVAEAVDEGRSETAAGAVARAETALRALPGGA